MYGVWGRDMPLHDEVAALISCDLFADLLLVSIGAAGILSDNIKTKTTYE